MEPNNNPTPMQNSGMVPESGAAPVPPVQPASPLGSAGPVPTPSTAAGGMTTPPVNPIINPTGDMGGGMEGLAATDPIMRPEPAPRPDPVEEELRAPMVAAAPVPGSIGSAVSGAADDRQVPSVAFNDPAMQPDTAAGMTPASAPMPLANKKSNKTTLIALIAVAAVIVVVLAVILVMQLMGGSQGSSQVNTPAVMDVDDDEEEAGDAADAEGSEVAETLICWRDMTAAELANYTDARSGVVNAMADFDSEGTAISVTLAESVNYGGEDDEPKVEKSSQATKDTLDATTAANYHLPVDENSEVDLSLDGVKAKWEGLGFFCE